MSNWSEILTEVNQSFPTNIDLLNKKRKEYMDKIAEITGRNVITYYSGWLKNPNAPFISINDSDMNAFMTNVYRLDRSKGFDFAYSWWRFSSYRKYCELSSVCF